MARAPEKFKGEHKLSDYLERGVITNCVHIEQIIRDLGPVSSTLKLEGALEILGWKRKANDVTGFHYRPEKDYWL